jgi:long-chain acyl-CoA synthetase
MRKREGKASIGDSLWLALANQIMFPAIRTSIGADLKAIICGSAPLAYETQLFFIMVGIPVLQVYGLTETTAICTMDDPKNYEPGRVGPAIPGIEMKVGENEEIIVRGPNIFPGYWQKPAETEKALSGGWFHTGDQGDLDANGNWRITGRIKNLIILNSGHNIAPEPIEENIARLLPAAQQVVVVGNGRGYLCALVSGSAEAAAVQAVLDTMNPGLPHYRQIRNFTVIPEAFTIENGLLTANGKVRRRAINERYSKEIKAMYDGAGAREAASGKHA